MHKKIIIILIITSFVHCSKINHNKTEYIIPENTDNAAHYYVHAFKSLRSMGSYTESIVSKTISNGWNGESETALDYAKNNEKSLKSILNAFQLQKCDFNINNKKYSFEQNINFLKLLELSDLVFFNIEYELFKKNMDEAMKLYQGSLDFARHVAQNKKMLAKMVCITIELNFIQSIKRLISSNKFDKKHYKIASAMLKDYLDNRFNVNDQVQNEKGFYFETLGYLVDNQINSDKKNIQKKKIARFLSDINSFGKHSADNYFSILAQAAINNKPKNWEKVDIILKNLETNVDQFIGNIKGIKGISDLINNNPDRLKKTFAKQMADMVLKLTIVDMRVFVDKNNRAVDELVVVRDIAYEKSL